LLHNFTALLDRNGGQFQQWEGKGKKKKERKKETSSKVA
jgi:hypothetical protein